MNLLQDLRFALRLLAKERGFTVAAATALALGIGMNATVFTLVNSLLFQSLPYEDSDRLMYVGERDTVTGRPFMVSWPDFQDWRDVQTSLSASAPGRPAR
jgi:putative ABC transport system permease protein